MCFEQSQLELRVSDNQIELLPPAQGCNHDRNICDPCLKRTWELEIDAGNTALTCPTPDCRAEVSSQDVRRFVSKESFSVSVSLPNRYRCKTETVG